MSIIFLPKIALNQRLYIIHGFFPDLGSKFNLQQNGHHLNAPGIQQMTPSMQDWTYMVSWHNVEQVITLTFGCGNSY